MKKISVAKTDVGSKWRRLKPLNRIVQKVSIEACFIPAMVLCKQIVLVSTFDDAILRIQRQFVEDKNR